MDLSKTVLVLLIFLFSVNIVYSQVPSLKLVIVNEKNSVNPGDSLKSVIYISGIGPIKKNKIRVFIPPFLLNPEDPGLLTTNIHCRYQNNTPIPWYREDSNPIYEGVVSLTECNFLIEKEPPTDFAAPLLLSEWEKAPMYINLNISEDAKPGDYEIQLIFTYSADEINWYQDRGGVKIHVNSPVEQYRYYVFLLLTIIAIVLSGISGWTKEKYKMLRKSRIGYLILIGIILAILWILYLIYLSLG